MSEADATTLTLTDFLLARIAEDEESAREPFWLALEYGVDGGGRDLFATRVLAECEAKRRIVEAMSLPSNLMSPTSRRVAEIARDVVLNNLASVYAEHPDFREEWRS